jgi:lysophospholipase L1-like esterase
MTMHRLKILAAVLALALVPTAVLAQVDFTRYVSFGDSLTAGFVSGSLNRAFQVNSYPALIFRAGTGTSTGFEQPLVTEPGIPAILTLRSLSPLTIAPVAGIGAPANLTLGRVYNNLAVPGARLHDFVATTTDNGGLHDLILRHLGGSQLAQGLSFHPTFVTLWIGNNDALGAATAGIVNDQTLTPAASFEAEYKAATDAIAASGAKMALANIPNVTSIPFVNTLSRFLVNPATNQPVLVGGAPVPLIGPDGPLQAGDFVLLTASTQLAQGRGIPQALGGTGQPLSDSVVLNSFEAGVIQERIAAFNAVIAGVATAKNAALFDANAAFTAIKANGVNVGGITFTTSFLTGGIFSYDGVHPTAFGYGVVANMFIDAINAKFGGNIPHTNLFPLMFGPAIGSSTAVFDGKRGPVVSGAPFLFTDEAARNLMWVIGTAKATPPPHKPRGGHHH